MFDTWSCVRYLSAHTLCRCHVLTESLMLAMVSSDSISEWRPRLLRFRHSLMVAMVSSDSSSAFQARLSSPCLTAYRVCAISPLTLHAAILCQLLVSEFTAFTLTSLPSNAIRAQFPGFICTALIPRMHVHYRFDDWSSHYDSLFTSFT